MTLLGVALQTGAVLSRYPIFALYTLSFLAAFAAAIQVPARPIARWITGREYSVAMVLVLLDLLLQFAYGQVLYLTPGTERLSLLFPTACSVICLIFFNAMMKRPVLGKVQPIVAIGLWALIGFVLLRCTANPHIDTYPMTQESCIAMAHGHNPFATTFPDIYGTSEPLCGYPPGFSVNGRVLAGYSYMPTSFLMAFPGYLIFGDHRYMLVIYFVAIGLLIADLKPTRHAVIAAALLFSFQRSFIVLESAWTEPMVLVLLAAVIWSAQRWTSATPWLFGLFLSSKQHLFLFAPAALWLMPRPLSISEIIRFYAKAIGIAVAVTLPFVLWDFHAFWHSVVELQLKGRPRIDSLSFPTLYTLLGFGAPPRFVSLLLVPVAYALAWWRLPKTLSGFAVTLAFVAFVTIAFDQAFLNRNFFVMATMLFAIAVIPEELPSGNSVNRLELAPA